MPDRWNSVADIRRRQIESGSDLTFSRVFIPYYTDLVATLAPTSLLEVGCGTGHLSALLEHLVPAIVALEPSPGMYGVAKEVLRNKHVKLLDYSVEDYQDSVFFDMIISHMCVQVVDNLDSLFGSVALHMGTDSLFVFAMPHPCFYNSYKTFFKPDEYHYMHESRKTVSFTITKDPKTPISGIPYNHRPLSEYFSRLKVHGLCVVDFTEIFPVPEVQALYGQPWNSPRYCVFHAKKQW